MEISLNPVTHLIKINATSKLNVIFVYDYSGKEIKRLRTVPNNEINVKDLASGGYILAIQTRQGIVMKKFIKSNRNTNY
ncbi:T9SS type A sorting domain-containing protein [Apibacter sp. HY039]|uniref:T9SS type A sorting domain-containing protein n=1 Tax=Apibacter sp. HY039 TaxID=2501476 RepID=UPI0013E3A50D|nr:T9SS type A sorting domain-containing protein [Apibacter sp. HY039]